LNTSRVESRESKAARGHRCSGLVLRPASAAFSLVEIMVVVVLMSFIVLALMAVFNSTQQAFRSSMTQTDVLEGGRAAIEMITADVRQMTPSFKANTLNFCVTNDQTSGWLATPLVGTSGERTNALSAFFILTRGNEDGRPVLGIVGYAVAPFSSNGLYSLYRFSTNRHELAEDPRFFFRDFTNFTAHITNNGSHLMDGVVHLTVRAYDTNGALISSNIVVRNVIGGITNVVTNAFAHNLVYAGGKSDDLAYMFYSNMVPSSVEVEMGILEDRVLQRAESRPPGTGPGTRGDYLAAQAGKVHVFRQRVNIPSIDPAGY